jgi:protein-tyrosine phosphatase
VYPPAQRELAKHGISCRGHAARQMTPADYDYYDYLVAMEPYNIRSMLRITDDPAGKMRLLMSFAGSDEGIDDPWYTGRFAEVYRQIETGCRAMLNELGIRN